MRLLAIMLSALLLLGCITMGNEGNQGGGNDTAQPGQNTTQPATNGTGQGNQTGPSQQQWVRYNAGDFSFEYPEGMVTNAITGKFMGASRSGNLTTERMMLSSLNTLRTYGANKDEIFKANPGKAASDFLLQDADEDPLGLLDNGQTTGELSTSTIERDVYVSQMPFTLRSGGVTYSGHAISMFVPARSLYVRARILATDPDRAEAIRDNFILSFRLE